MRLRKVAGEWFPTVPADVLDQIVAAAWIEGREANGGSGERTAVVAAAAVRRHGLRALRGDGIDLPEDAEKRIAALTADETGSEPRAQRFRRRARPEALGRRAPDHPVVSDERSDAPAPAVRKLQRDDDGEDDGPPTRRRRGTRDEARPAADRRQPDDAERGPRSLRILAETVQIITGRRADDDTEIVEVVADEPKLLAPKPADPTASAAPTSPVAPARPAAAPRPTAPAAAKPAAPATPAAPAAKPAAPVAPKPAAPGRRGCAARCRSPPSSSSRSSPSRSSARCSAATRAARASPRCARPTAPATSPRSCRRRRPRHRPSARRPSA